MVSASCASQKNENLKHKKIAVIGAGISGLGAAYLLSDKYKVTLFESEKRLGGHARTLFAGRGRQVPVDTGFIVFNYRNYPHLTGLFELLNVPVKKSDMSFAASINDGRIEYGLQTLRAIFAQKRNMLHPNFLMMLRDIFRFNNLALATANGANLTTGELLDKLNMRDWFRNYFLLPISGAIWSTAPKDMLSFPAKTFTRFFDNHGLLTINDQPQWWTVDGGSREYVMRIEQAMLAKGVDIRLGAEVISVIRENKKVSVYIKGCELEEFDEVVFGCHSDQALAMLAHPHEEEQQILGALKYKANKAYLHDDASYMPKRKSCWASWVYKGHSKHVEYAIPLTYWMNRLQSIPNDVPLFVTLNPIEEIEEKYIFDETVFYHPQFDQLAIEAQGKLPSLQGKRSTWYCGAYTRYGFHEDGLLSAVNVAKSMGIQIPWE